MGIKRKVVCVFGKFGKETDFVLEPACPKDSLGNECKCELCEEAFWIEEVEKPKGYEKVKKNLKKLISLGIHKRSFQ